MSGPILGSDPLWVNCRKQPPSVCDHWTYAFNLVAYGSFDCKLVNEAINKRLSGSIFMKFCCFWAERETGLQSKRNLELQPRPQGGSLALGVGRPTSKAREKRPGDEVARARVPQENACNVGFKYQINLHLPSLVFLRLLCRLLTLQLAAPSDSGLFLLASFFIWKTS